ncbi:MAG: hypothetical protein ACLU9S_12035 [Oscillospiraceae bacterium]
MTYRPFSLGRRGRRFLALALVKQVHATAALPVALAANPEVDADGLLFPSAEFQTGASDDFTGHLRIKPQGASGTVQLGSRVICPGHSDHGAAGCWRRSTPPLPVGRRRTTYLPIYGNRVEGRL